MPLAEALISERGLAIAGAGIGMGIAVLGGGRGIGQIGGQACEGIARQPEAGGRIGTNMIISAALIEGFTFTAIILAFVLANKLG
jgi:F-type H+-transporting ATPase subunit c